jgi:hypothetical protein
MLAGVGIGLTIALKNGKTMQVETDYSKQQLTSVNKQIWWKTLR